MLLPADKAATETFLEEMRRAAGVSSKHVLSVSAVGVDEGSDCPYIVTEFLEGRDLSTAVAAAPKGPLAGWDDVVSQVAQALGAGHAVGISHGHLSPEMVVLAPTATADPFRAVLLDLGLPQAAWSRAKASVKVAWTAPEAAGGGGPSPAADVWAFGQLCFFVVTGKHYFKAANAPTVDAAALATEARQGISEPASVRAKSLGVEGALPRHFDAFFAKCTAADPAARLRDATVAWEGASDLLSAANELSDEVTEAADGPEDVVVVAKAQKPPPLPLMAAIKENPKPAIAAALALVAVAAVLGVGMGSFLRKPAGATSAKSKALIWAGKPAEECEKGCTGGDAAACHGLGLIAAAGDKLPKDEGKAATLFDKACKGGDMSACTSLAERYLSGEGVKEDATEAAALLGKACEGAEAGACADLSDLHRDGRGVPRDDALRKKYRTLACKGGVLDACGAP